MDGFGQARFRELLQQSGSRAENWRWIGQSDGGIEFHNGTATGQTVVQASLRLY